MVRWVIDYLVYLLVRVFVCVVQATSLAACRGIAGGLATLATDVLRLRRGVIEENLGIVFPGLSAAERRRLTWEMWEHLFLMVAEIAHLPRKVHRSNWQKYFDVPNREEVVRLLADGRPKVIVSGHFGNFELSGYVLALFGFPSVTVARPLDNPFLHRFVNEFRGRTGQTMLPKQGSSADADRLLAAGGLLAILADQAAGPKGCWVDFLGRPASTHKAIAVLALSNDAPLMVGCARRLGKPMHYAIAIAGVADPRETPPELQTVEGLTQWHTDVLAALVRESPEQYWWVHRRWKGEPPVRKRRVA